MMETKSVIPGKLAVAAQPRPEDLADLAAQGFKTLINNRPDDEAENQPKAKDMRVAASRHGMDYLHIPVTTETISKQDIDAFRAALEKTTGPVVAHCGTGKRAYLLWAAGEVLYRGRSVDELVNEASNLGLDVKELHQISERSGKRS